MRKTIARLVKWCLPKTAYPVLRGPLKGLRCYLGSFAGEGGGISVFFNLSEPEQTALFNQHIKLDDIIFDIGANVGYYSMLGSKITTSGGVYAIEPMIANLTWIDRHVKINRLKNITIIPMACSDKDSFANFTEGDNNALGFIQTILKKETTKKQFTPANLVATIRVDRLVELLGVCPSVLKIDVEGAEKDVLMGAEMTLKNHHPKIFLSTHSVQLNRDCVALLRSLNYKVSPINGSNEEDATEFFAEQR